jgi:hypothetical protein
MEIGAVGIVALVALAIAAWIGLVVWLWRDYRKGAAVTMVLAISANNGDRWS